jgi:hypothetical protein
VGYDAGKKVKGRKLHALVDVEGAVTGRLTYPPRRSPDVDAKMLHHNAKGSEPSN